MRKSTRWGEIVALDVPVTLGDGTTYTCLKTRDYSSADAGLEAFKYYAPGIGTVLEEEHGERVELVSVE